MKDRSSAYKYESVNGEKASNLLEYLAQGGRSEDIIKKLAKPLLKYVTDRKDCADFRAAYLIRVLLSYEDYLPTSLVKHIRDGLLAFPYLDCGGHSMCTWTENHRLYAAGTEYLLARRYPDAFFGDGRDAKFHRDHGEKEISSGLSEMLKYGFAEWGSNNYYSETMAGLANIVQFAGKAALRDKAKKCLRMMVYDVLSQASSVGGVIYNPACSRAYADNKATSDQGNYLEPQIRAMMGEKVTRFKEKEGCMILLLEATDWDGESFFEVPEAWKTLPATDGREIAMVQGVNINDYKKEGLKEYSPENVRSAFKAGAISDYRVICNSMRYLNESGLIDNGMLAPLKPYAKPILYKTGLLKLMKWFVPTGFDGAAMEEGRVYTYACSDYSVSAAFDYRVGKVLFQQNPLAVNIGYKVSLFVTNPFSGPEGSGSPGYWIGSGTAPRTVAYKDFAAAVFDLKHAKKDFKYTHLFFPTGLFDEVDISELEKGFLFGRLGRVNVCVRTNPGAAFVPIAESLKNDKALLQDGKIPAGYYTKEYDLVNRAEGMHFYAFETDVSLPFDKFKAHAMGRVFGFSPETGALYSDQYECKFSYEGSFSVGGKEFVPEFKRPWEIAKKKA